MSAPNLKQGDVSGLPVTQSLIQRQNDTLANTNTPSAPLEIAHLGTKNKETFLTLASQLAFVTPVYDTTGTNRELMATVNIIDGIAPKDALEMLLVVQMMGVHNTAMEYLRRTLSAQTLERATANGNVATRFLRTFTAQMEALNRHRGKLGDQVVVGNVNVNEGGKAIVGPVTQPPPSGKLDAKEDAKTVE